MCGSQVLGEAAGGGTRPFLWCQAPQRGQLLVSTKLSLNTGLGKMSSHCVDMVYVSD